MNLSSSCANGRKSTALTLLLTRQGTAISVGTNRSCESRGTKCAQSGSIPLGDKEGVRLVVVFGHSGPCRLGGLLEHSESAQAMSCQRPLRLLTTAPAARLARQTSSAPRHTRHRAG